MPSLAKSTGRRLGVAPHVIERVLNPITGSQSGVAGIHNHYGYLTEKQQALELCRNTLCALRKPAPDKLWNRNQTTPAGSSGARSNSQTCPGLLES